MKRLVVLLVVLGCGVVAAAVAIPSNAVTVNGTSISQSSLNSDVSAIAASAYYQCYLNSDAYVSSGGTSVAPPVQGAGTGQVGSGAQPTAGSAFVATYLDTQISAQIVDQQAAKRGVTVTQAQLDQTRASLTGHITQVMRTTARTGNPSLTCGASGTPLTGQQVLATMPASFVDEQVQQLATATTLYEELSGVGSSDARLHFWYLWHRSQFDTVCLDAAAFSSESSAQQASAAVANGTPFTQAVSGAAQSGSLGCGVLSSFAAELGTSAVTLDQLALNEASAPLQTSSGWFVVAPTQRAVTPWPQARQAVTEAVERRGAAAAQKLLAVAGRRSSVHVNPQYGIWVGGTANVFTPLTPRPTDTPNAAANEPGAPAASAGSTSG